MLWYNRNTNLSNIDYGVLRIRGRVEIVIEVLHWQVYIMLHVTEGLERGEHEYPT